MTTSRSRSLAPVASALTLLVALACTPSDPETAASPVQAATRTAESIKGAYGDVTSTRGDDGSRTRKVLAPAPAVWDALVAAMDARKVKPTILDRSVGRIGDTSMVIMRRWQDKPASYYFNCGAGMTGQRADDDRLKAVLLAQTSRLRADTIAVVVHFSAFATSLTSGSTAQCISTGRGENDLLQEVAMRLGTR
jgi:hypothetical protein